MAPLEDFGWDEGWAAVWAAAADGELRAARVAAVHREAFVVWTEEGERTAELSGHLRHRALGEGTLPAVGDWIAVRPPAATGPALVQLVLPRRTRMARKVPGAVTAEQVVAANVDVVLVIAGLDGDYNPRRLERTLVLARDGGAQPVIVLNKADLHSPEELAETMRQTGEVAGGVPVLALSASTGVGVDALSEWLVPRRTAALIGSSGAGKSTLVNRLIGEERQRTSAVRASDSRGRHTTSHRELMRMPGGALIIDTPGVRELQLWATPDTLDGTFADLEELAASCRFTNCTHDAEPGCAVTQAAASGALAPERLESYRKLRRELRHLELRQDEVGRLEQKQRWRAIHKAARKHRPRE
jgi:ribosome biogenesis GTPase